MADAPTCFLDTNIVMYAVGKEHPLKAPCAAVLRALEGSEIKAVTSVEVLQEIVHRYQVTGRLDLAQRIVGDLKVLCEEILPVDLVDLEQAVSLLRAYPAISARDALHVAVMRRHGIEQILSTDRHFDDVAEIRRLDPAGSSDAEPSTNYS